jgi:hypothetical protein
MDPKAPARMAGVAGLLVLGISMLAVPGAGAAAADPPGGGGSPSCVVAAADSAPLPDVVCFPTLAAAIAHVTGGALRLPAEAQTVEETQLRQASSRAAARGPRGSLVLGIEYLHAGLTGPSLVLTTSRQVGCNGTTSFDFPSMGALGWGDRISSAQAYAGCRSVHFEHAGLTGRSVACTCPSMGVLNDRTSSIRYR